MTAAEQDLHFRRPALLLSLLSTLLLSLEDPAGLWSISAGVCTITPEGSVSCSDQQTHTSSVCSRALRVKRNCLHTSHSAAMETLLNRKWTETELSWSRRNPFRWQMPQILAAMPVECVTNAADMVSRWDKQHNKTKKQSWNQFPHFNTPTCVSRPETWHA